MSAPITSRFTAYYLPPMVFASLLLLALSSCSDSSETGDLGATVTATGAIEAGRISYMAYCLNCHGENGGGDGPLTELITLTPADLTTLAEGNGGTFPTEMVDGVIRGYDEELMVAHGDREMPVWEDVWKEQSGSSDVEAVIDARIAELLAFLETVQE